MEYEEFQLLQWALNYWDSLLTTEDFIKLESHQLSYLEIDNYFY